jgi:hypothetical protein
VTVFHALLIEGDATPARVTGPIVGLSDLKSTAWVIADDGRGALIVTTDDPAKLKARYHSRGFLVCSVNTPLHSKRVNDFPEMVAIDMKLSGEYEEMRRFAFD